MRDNLEQEISNKECLAMAVFSIISTNGPKGLCPILMVYDTLPITARTMTEDTQLWRAQLCDEEIEAASKEKA